MSEKNCRVFRIIAFLLVLSTCLPFYACTFETESNVETSEESTREIYEEPSEIISEESHGILSEESSEESFVECSEVSLEESIEESSDFISEEISEESIEESSVDISETVSEETSEESSEDWTNQGTTYFEETGKCTYTTVYSPKTNDKVTYEKSGIYLYNTEFRMSPELEAEFLTLFSSFENPQSVTVREINSEFVFSYNPNKRIACASAIKAPFGLFAAKCVEQGLVSWEERLVYEEKYDYFTGSGVIQENFEYGTQFSVKRLFELMLYISDNIAYLMLKDRFGGATPFNDSMNALGCKDIIDWGNWGKLTSYEMALVWREIYHYTKSGSPESKKLYKELDRALYNELEKGIQGKENLHKSGWSANGYNDAGIFFDGEQTYVVAVMTGRKELTDGRNKTQLVKISKLIDKLIVEYNEFALQNG